MKWSPIPESDRGVAVLQTVAFPLGQWGENWWTIRESHPCLYRARIAYSCYTNRPKLVDHTRIALVSYRCQRYVLLLN